VKRFGLTGGIATGKSHVVARLREAGVPVVDADVLAREVVKPGTPGFEAVVSRFGREVVGADGALDRRRLGGTVFADERARRDLEAIVHPPVRAAIRAFFVALPAQTPFAVADIPLLYETGRETEFDGVIVVSCDRQTQIARIMSRDRLSREEAERRVAAQLPIGEKRKRADYLIDSSGSHADTDRQVAELVTRLTQESAAAH
jgi:dephospho-CoA kinase